MIKYVKVKKKWVVKEIFSGKWKKEKIVDQLNNWNPQTKMDDNLNNEWW